jgi:hypothetical protein
MFRDLGVSYRFALFRRRAGIFGVPVHWRR